MKRKVDIIIFVFVVLLLGDSLYELSFKVEKKIINFVSIFVMLGKIFVVRRESNRKIIKFKRDLFDE